MNKRTTDEENSTAMRWVQLDGNKIRKYRSELKSENGKGFSREGFIELLQNKVLASEELAKTHPYVINWVYNKTKDTASGLAISIDALLQIENGYRKSSKETAEFLAAGMGVELRELIKKDNRGRDVTRTEYGRVFPVPVMFPQDMLHMPISQNNCPTSVNLLEIVAIRRSDRKLTVLGYGDLTEESLYTLINHWVGGGFEALMEWGGIDENDSFVFNSTSGLGIGSQSEASPKLIIGFSGCEIRSEFTHPRSQSGLVRIQESN